MSDSDMRLRVASGIAKTETEASQIVFTMLKGHGVLTNHRQLSLVTGAVFVKQW